MSDFLAWFLQKHWLVASVLFPELSLVWAVWQREFIWAAFLAVVVVLIKFWKASPYILIEWPPRRWARWT